MPQKNSVFSFIKYKELLTTAMPKVTFHTVYLQQRAQMTLWWPFS